MISPNLLTLLINYDIKVIIAFKLYLKHWNRYWGFYLGDIQLGLKPDEIYNRLCLTYDDCIDHNWQ